MSINQAVFVKIWPAQMLRVSIVYLLYRGFGHVSRLSNISMGRPRDCHREYFVSTQSIPRDLHHLPRSSLHFERHIIMFIISLVPMALQLPVDK